MNPRAAINDLLPFQGSPFGQLGYFSIMVCTKNALLTYPHSAACFSVVLRPAVCRTSGESGIRTHAPLRTNGFQDRLVMTTSISLQARFSQNAREIISSGNRLVNRKFRKICSFFILFYRNASAMTRSSGVVILMFR